MLFDAHEAGHAVVATALPHTDPVHQVTIVPRGRAGGFTMVLPKEDKYFATRVEMMEQIIHLLGGRVAEKLTLDDISTGASNDIQRATDIARDMTKQKIGEYEQEFSNPYRAAEMGYVDDVIEPASSRQRIISAFDMLKTKRESLPAKKHGNIPL